jgi:hypothetical protein
MPGLVPGIHALAAKKGVDGRAKPGHDVAKVECNRLSQCGENDYLCFDPRAGCMEAPLLNRYDRSLPMSGEAEVKYLDGDFRVVRPGAFVRCAVTGVPIPLEELKYWSVDLQEAYASPQAVLQRLKPQAAQ